MFKIRWCRALLEGLRKASVAVTFSTDVKEAKERWADGEEECSLSCSAQLEHLFAPQIEVLKD